MGLNRIAIFPIILCLSFAVKAENIVAIQGLNIDAIQMTSIQGNAVIDKEGYISGNGFTLRNIVTDNPGIIKLIDDDTNELDFNYQNSLVLSPKSGCNGASLTLNNIYFDVPKNMNGKVQTYPGYSVSKYFSARFDIPNNVIGCEFEGSLPVYFGTKSASLPIDIKILQASSVLLIRELNFGVIQKIVNETPNVFTMDCSGNILQGDAYLKGSYNNGLFRVIPSKTGNAVISVSLSNALSSDVSFIPNICYDGTSIISGVGSVNYSFNSLNAVDFSYAGSLSFSNINNFNVGDYEMTMVVSVDYQ